MKRQRKKYFCLLSCFSSKPYNNLSIFFANRNGDCRNWDIYEGNKTIADVYKITENGNEFIREIHINNNKLHINLPEKIGYKIILK